MAGPKTRQVDAWRTAKQFDQIIARGAAVKIFVLEISRTETAAVRIVAETDEEAESALEEYGVDSFVRGSDWSGDCGSWVIDTCSEDTKIDPKEDLSDMDAHGGVLNGKFYPSLEEFIEAYENWLVELGQRPPPPDPNQLSLPIDGKERK